MVTGLCHERGLRSTVRQIPNKIQIKTVTVLIDRNKQSSEFGNDDMGQTIHRIRKRSRTWFYVPNQCAKLL